MTLKFRKFISIIAVFIIVFCLLIIALIIYNKFRDYQSYKEVFPDQPVIKNVSNPKIAAETNVKGINFPIYLENLFYYFDNNNLIRINLDNLQKQLISSNLIDSSKILEVKGNGELLLIGHYHTDLYSTLDENEETVDNLAYTDRQYLIYNLNSGNKKNIINNNELRAAFFTTNANQILILEYDYNNDFLLSKIDLNGNFKDELYNFGQDPIDIISLNSQITNCLYYSKFEITQNLYKICLDTLSPQKIIDNFDEANISADEKYALINQVKNNKYQTKIFNLTTNHFFHTFELPILANRAIWDKQSNNLYYMVGENLKAGDESDYLDRKPSYVLFKYNIKNDQNSQLNNHIFDNPVDAQNLFLNEITKKIYFINIYMSENSLFYFNL